MGWAVGALAAGRHGGAAALATLLVACASVAYHPSERSARELGFAVQDLPGEGFVHRVFVDAAAEAILGGGEPVDAPAGIRRMHVYIDGDGTPWLGPGRPSLEPGPRNTLLLRLMVADPEPSLYLGRPCYAGAPERDRCHPWYWTHGRYGEDVVASMEQVLRDLVARGEIDELVLIGYSGGGALAMLLAPRLAEVAGVVTIAGNLAPALWAEHHGYSPLTGSLDPASLPPLDPGIRQWHWMGGDDRVVPPFLVKEELLRQPAAHARVLPGVDHACCWEREWPLLLRAMAGQD